ncbi:MAG: hypothetical protein CK425_10340 [Parachlamydia sp.]|nr:MAG: hypothetical protein CK425_10340 [Parachlamydia sp.]
MQVSNLGPKGKVTLECVWEGPSIPTEKEQDKIVLVFKNTLNQYHLTIPQESTSSGICKLPISFKKIDEEGTCDLLKVSVEQIKNLTICAGVSKEIPLKLPLQLDSRRDYRLALSCTGDLCARLDFSDVDEMCEFIEMRFSMVFLMEQAHFHEQSLSANFQLNDPSRSCVFFNPIQVFRGDFHRDLASQFYFEKKAIRTVIEKLDPEALQNVMVKIRALKLNSEPPKLEVTLETQIFDLCKEIITPQGFFDMMMLLLTSRVFGQITPECQDIIVDMSYKFMKSLEN